MFDNILVPAMVLVLWTFVMLIWMTAVRFPAMSKVNLHGKVREGGRGRDLNGVLPDRVNWKAHNHDHLFEQPTIFYPTVLVLHVMDAVAPLTIGLAWAYVILRIAHSLWQSLVNKVFPTRVILFVLSSTVLLVLAIMAMIAVLGSA